MPLFVFMSGLFAKGAYRGGKLNVDRILSFLVLGFGFQIALALVNGAALTPARILSFTSAPWYLVSMAHIWALNEAWHSRSLHRCCGAWSTFRVACSPSAEPSRFCRTSRSGTT